jgi:hypothetical protein
VSLARPLLAHTAPLLLVGAVLASLLIGAAAVSVARADDGTEIGTGLSVEVISTSPTPSPSTTVGGISTTEGGTATSGTVGGTTTTGTTTSGGSSTTPPDSSVAGVLYVSGLSWTYIPSLNPLDGSLTLRFTVRNVFRETLSPTATFWINQIFGGPVDVPVVVSVDTLRAGETRVVEANFHGLAQWTMLSAHATLAVPGKGQVELAPILRDAIIWFLPWFIALLVAIGGAVILWRRLRPTSAAAAAGPRPGPDGAVAGDDGAAATRTEVP